MDSLYSIDETRKMRQKEIKNEIEANRIYNLVKKSQSYKPGIIERLIAYIKTVLGAVSRRLRGVPAHVTSANFRRSNAEIKPH